MKKVLALLCLFVFAANILVADTETWDVQSDTWPATDVLGRSLPDHAEVGTPKPEKFIGIFYFLWNGHHGEDGPYDVSKILQMDPKAKNDPNHPLWGPLAHYHHWAEPLFDYYVAEDPYVLRKHAQMLADAGVDVIIFDVTNHFTYQTSYKALCRVFQEMRDAGNKTPQIAFLAPFVQPEKVVRTLWKDLYSKPDYSELWFHWKGKPLILVDSDVFTPKIREYTSFNHFPAEVSADSVLGQAFTSQIEMIAVAASTPTWGTPNTSAELTLYEKDRRGKKLITKTFTNVSDNEWLTLKAEQPLPEGDYYLELRKLSGKLGWWTMPESDRIPGGKAFLNGKECAGNRSIRLTMSKDDPETRAILDYFTFREPQASYFVGPTGPDQWGWLEVYPQHGFYSSADPNKVEQVTVGTAQNAVDGKLSVLSHPRAHGRSFHNGKQPPPEQCDFSGKNFAEQWERAFELDPEFVFITGWNEWIAMRFPAETPFYKSNEQPVNFVDQFDREYSRDIEPMKGGHEDAFYYQMVAMNRRFKGVRKVDPIVSAPITIDGHFEDWKNVTPEFRDTIGDTAKRDHRGWNKESRYINQTGRNDLVAAKVSWNSEKNSLDFYVRTQETIIGQNEPNWMLLYLNIDNDAQTGWLGYDYMIEGNVVKQNKGNNYSWEQCGTVQTACQGNEYEISVPIDRLGCQTLPKSFQFKWADNILQTGHWHDFTLNGDAAPNDRYNYQATFE